MNQYPVNLIVEGRPCLVVGGGALAAKKAAALVACGAEVHVVGERIGPEVRGLPVTWEERSYSLGEVSGYRFAVVPHPVSSLDEKGIREHARLAAPQVLAILRGEADG